LASGKTGGLEHSVVEQLRRQIYDTGHMLAVAVILSAGLGYDGIIVEVHAGKNDWHYYRIGTVSVVDQNIQWSDSQKYTGATDRPP
jgi:hypothetical protein